MENERRLGIVDVFIAFCTTVRYDGPSSGKRTFTDICGGVEVVSLSVRSGRNPHTPCATQLQNPASLSVILAF
jgi:hypothetical protein